MCVYRSSHCWSADQINADVFTLIDQLCSTGGRKGHKGRKHSLISSSNPEDCWNAGNFLFYMCPQLARFQCQRELCIPFQKLWIEVSIKQPLQIFCLQIHSRLSDYVTQFTIICLFVMYLSFAICLFVCQQDYINTARLIFRKHSEGVAA